MPGEPTVKRAHVFIDGQNLFHAAKEAFGYAFPNYDIGKLTLEVCKQNCWQLDQIRFYTGIPDKEDDPFWNHFWTAKLSAMGRQGVKVFSRPLRYRNQTVKLPDGSNLTFLVGQEKGVDIRIALDVVSSVRRKDCDVAVVFSQDQDLSEVADEVRMIAREQGRWIKIATAFPVSPTAHNRRGVNKTDWVRIDRKTYDACIDPNDYRPKKVRGK
ncbi:MAG TPA: NYN domain-containing protein [Candidatus Brocadiia bacterium]|nr:NYN domain-containing protein [Candidatus Brocadiia bacterium]